MSKPSDPEGITPPITFELNLLENGIDFIRSGIETFFLEDTPDPSSHKYAVLHLFSGVQLLLKELLRREHPSLVFEKVEDLKSKDARTVTFEQTIVRLQSCAGVELPARILKRLTTAKRIRNSLEHHRLELNLPQTQTVIGQLAEFAYELLRDHLDVSLEEHLSSAAWRRIQTLRSIAARIEKEELARKRERLRRYKRLPAKRLREIADQAEYHPDHNPDARGLFWCEECCEQTVAIAEGDIAVCTNPKCRELFEVGHCYRCGEPTFNGLELCDSCEDYIRGQ